MIFVHWGVLPRLAKTINRAARRKPLLAVFGFAVFIALAQAVGAGQARRLSPALEAWTKTLTDETGVSCCTLVNGFRPTEVEWVMGANYYRVKIQGKWVLVPDEAVVKGPNRLGYAAVWYDIDYDINLDDSSIEIRCFLPGPAV